jgi:hypothetical protein
MGRMDRVSPAIVLNSNPHFDPVFASGRIRPAGTTGQLFVAQFPLSDAFTLILSTLYILVEWGFMWPLISA